MRSSSTPIVCVDASLVVRLVTDAKNRQLSGRLAGVHVAGAATTAP